MKKYTITLLFTLVFAEIQNVSAEASDQITLSDKLLATYPKAIIHFTSKPKNFRLTKDDSSKHILKDETMVISTMILFPKEKTDKKIARASCKSDFTFEHGKSYEVDVDADKESQTCTILVSEK